MHGGLNVNSYVPRSERERERLSLYVSRVVSWQPVAWLQLGMSSSEGEAVIDNGWIHFLATLIAS